MKVGVNSEISFPLPFIPSHQSLRLETEGRGRLFLHKLGFRMERISSVDVHAHLDEREDLPESLKEARVAGVLGILLEIE